MGSLTIIRFTCRGIRETGHLQQMIFFLRDVYKRQPLYEKYADITIDEEGKDLDESLRAILEIIHIKEQGK